MAKMIKIFTILMVLASLGACRQGDRLYHGEREYLICDIKREGSFTSVRYVFETDSIYYNRYSRQTFFYAEDMRSGDIVEYRSSDSVECKKYKTEEEVEAIISQDL